MKFQGDILNFGDFIQVFVFTSYHHLKSEKLAAERGICDFGQLSDIQLAY